MTNFRVGAGFDVHAFAKAESADNTISLGGMLIPCKYKIIAHSDGDVLLHAITDALLGAAALGDIGEHFPPSDPQWRDANSGIFLKHAHFLLKNRNWGISNIDVVVMCETPKLMNYKKSIESSVADLLGLASDQVSVKATTTEKLGFAGREEGIAVTANCLIYKLA